MLSKHFPVIKLFLTAVTLVGVLTGCQHSAPQPPATSFANTRTCVNNSFLQKYNCDTAQIEQAAISGDPDAQYALGYLFYYGIGLSRNQQMALMWIRKAAAQDQPLAKQALLIMQKKDYGTPQPIIDRQFHYSEVPANSNPAAVPPANSSATSTNPSSNSFSSSSLYHPGPDNADSTNAPIQGTSLSSPQNPPLTSELPAYNEQNSNGKSSSSGGAASSSGSSNSSSGSQSAPMVDMLKSSDAGSKNPAVGSPDQLAQNDQAFTPDEKYLLSENPSSYTIQLLASHNLQSIIDFVQTNHLRGQANYYKTSLQDKNWFLLIDGKYPNKTEAEAAIQQLSYSVKAQNPWVRSFAEIQQQIKERD